MTARLTRIILLHVISGRDMIDRLGHRRVTLADCNKSNQILAWRNSFDLKRVAESFLSFTIAHENKSTNENQTILFKKRENLVNLVNSIPII